MRFSKPFRHAVIDNFIAPETVRAINAQWPEKWNKEDGKFTLKWSRQELPPVAAAVAESIELDMLERVTGIQGLFPDPDRFGAGLHCIPKKGFLKMHVDFNVHPKGWHRRVNVLIYLNEIWKDAWGGDLQLGLGNRAKLVAPMGGRCVIFETNEQSWHGHPTPLRCPRGVQRRSMALYYYTRDPPAGEPHTTIYKR